MHHCLEDGAEHIPDEKTIAESRYNMITRRLCLILIICVIGLAIPNRLQAQNENEMEGLWVEIAMNGDDSIDAFSPSFLSISRVEDAFMGLFVSYYVVDDRRLANASHALYRSEQNELISSGTRYEFVSRLVLTDDGQLVHVVEGREGGETFYRRPTLEDFQALIEWYGYDLR